MLLDVNADRYLALESAEAAKVSPFIRGWPLLADCNTAPDATLLGELVHRSLLTRDEGAGRDASPVAIQRPSTDFPLRHSLPSLRTSEVLGAVAAIVRAATLMRFVPLSRIVRRVSRRRNRFAGAEPAIEEARRLADVFDCVRPFLFSARDACLVECFSLLEFLASHGIYPLWVFGVRTKPFAAHCWLQHESSVLNDCVERTGSFTPIMTV